VRGLSVKPHSLESYDTLRDDQDETEAADGTEEERHDSDE
jgi:hypothetical protein